MNEATRRREASQRAARRRAAIRAGEHIGTLLCGLALIVTMFVLMIAVFFPAPSVTP